MNEGERIACVCEAHQRPKFSELLGLGWLFVPLHKTVLVLTNERIIEVLMDLRGTRPTTRVRSFPWGAATDIGLRFSVLTLKTGGSTFAWRIGGSRFRKLLAVLVPRLQQHFLEVTGYVPAAEACFRHCPECGNALQPASKVCDHCSTRFRTEGMAEGLSWAFPGGGLFYAGRPIFGLTVLIGELLLFGILAGILALGRGSENIVLIATVPFFLVAAKYESSHISKILVRRTIPIRTRTTRNWIRFAVVGGIVSIVAFVSATQLMSARVGSEPPVIVGGPRFDLDFGTIGEDWKVTRNVDEFALVDDGRQRSQWSSGPLEVFVLRDPPPPLGTWREFRDDLLARYSDRGLEPIVDEGDLRWGLEGTRFRVLYPDETDPVVELYVIVWDKSDGVIHSVVTYVPASETAATRAMLDRLLSHARFIEAIEPAH